MTNTTEMIRFRCQCGKKLKADESIVGRKVRCTNCGEINRVPATSTAAPGINSNAAAAAPINQPIVLDVGPVSSDESLIGNVEESDSFDFDPALIDLGTPATSSAAVEPLAAANPVADLKIDVTTPAQRKTRSKREFKSETLVYALLTAGGLIGLVALGWLGVWLFSGSPTYSEAFEASEPVKHYRFCLAQYDKAQRSVAVQLEIYRKTKSPPEEEVAEVEAYVEETRRFPGRETTLAAAYEKFEQGDEKGAQKLLADASRTLNRRRPELEAKAIELRDLSLQE